jgi:hypothetical protein
MTASIWPYISERSTTCRFPVDLGTGILLIFEDPVSPDEFGIESVNGRSATVLTSSDLWRQRLM